MTNSIFILLAILLGFCLGRIKDINPIVSRETSKIKENIKKRVDEIKYKPSVISTNEADLEREQMKQEKDKIDIKEFDL